MTSLRNSTSSKLLVVLLVSALAAPAVAQPLKLPRGATVTVGANRMKAYTLEEMRVVLKVYAAYRAGLDKIRLLEGVAKTHASTSTQKDAKIDALMKQRDQWKDAFEWKDKEWK